MTYGMILYVYTCMTAPPSPPHSTLPHTKTMHVPKSWRQTHAVPWRIFLSAISSFDLSAKTGPQWFTPSIHFLSRWSGFFVSTSNTTTTTTTTTATTCVSIWNGIGRPITTSRIFFSHFDACRGGKISTRSWTSRAFGVRVHNTTNPFSLVSRTAAKMRTGYVTIRGQGSSIDVFIFRTRNGRFVFAEQRRSS